MGIGFTNSVAYGYDPLGQLTSATGRETSGSLRLNEQFGYGYDPAGNLTRRTNNALVQSFAVNPLNQLTNLTRSGTLTVAGSTTSRATNVMVNTLAATLYGDAAFAMPGLPLVGGTTNFTAIARDASGRVDTNTVAVSLPVSSTLVFDANGNLRTNGNQVLEYDDENQLTSVTVSNGWRSEFVYDGLGRMRIKREFAWNSGVGTWTATNEVRLICDGMLVIQERDALNAPQVSYVRGKDLSGGFQRAGGIGGLLARLQHTSSPSLLSTTLYHCDGNGNVTGMFATNGLMVAWYLYDPFGNTLAKTGPLADANVYRFSCKAYHEPSGLYYYGYRFYSPDLQRWVNRDPIEEEGGINLYGFVENEPLSLVDPYGLDYGDWWDTRTWFNDGFTESWSDQANSIGQTLGEVLSGNWEDIENNYEDSSLGQAECIGGAVYTAERYLLAAAATATAAAAVTFAPTNPYLELALGAGLQLAFDALSPEGGDCDEGNPQVIGAIGPNGGQRSAEDQNRLDEQRDRRRIRREQESRVGTRQKQTGKGFRNLDSANKGPSGKSSSGIDTRHGRERNIGIDEEHSRVPKGSFGRPRR